MYGAATYRYAPPEFIEKGKISSAYDIWSFAALIYEFFSAEIPYTNFSTLYQL